MYSDLEIVNMFRKGMTKKGIAELIYFEVKKKDKKFNKLTSLQIVEQAILNEYLKSNKMVLNA